MLEYIGKAANNSDDDGYDDETDDWSEPANARASDNNDDNGDGDDNDSNDGDGEEDDDEIDKIFKDDHDIIAEHRNMQPRMGRTHRPETYRTGISPTVRAARPTHFDRIVRHIKQRDSVSSHEAMTRARIERPRAYRAFQRAHAESPTSEQWTRRGYRGSYFGKGAASSYEALVSEQMAKGVNMEVAGQRVAQAHGFRAFDNQMFKGETVVGHFERKVNALIRKGYDGTTACRLVREADGGLLYKALMVL
jgi:hypothetical protein